MCSSLRGKSVLDSEKIAIGGRLLELTRRRLAILVVSSKDKGYNIMLSVVNKYVFANP